MMLMGLILLAIMAIALFFTVGRLSFKALGLPQWGAFLVLLAFTVGIVVPTIKIRDIASIGFSGFILPIIASIALAVLLVRKNGFARGIVSMLAIVAISTILFLIMPMQSTGFRILTSITVGVITGAVGFIIGRTRLASVFAILSGVAVGNLIYSLISYFALDGGTMMLGMDIVYNSIFVAVLFILGVTAMASISGRIVEEGSYVRRELNYEAGIDEELNEYSKNENYDNMDDIF